jgi:hypothetical protein
MNTPDPVGAGGGEGPPRQRIKSLLSTVGPWIASALACLLFILIIASIFVGWERSWDKTLLHQLSDTATARGLITFLIAVATVGIALTLTVFIVATDDADPKNKFALGKEVLTALIGVLGTIVGFYFGASKDTSPHTAPLTITALTADPKTAKKGATASIDATISGGEPPYTYTVMLSQEGAKSLFVGSTGTSTDGAVKSQFAVPEDLDPNKKLDVILEATDKEKAMSRNQIDLPLAP